MHIPSLVKINWCLLKLSSGNEKRTDGRWMDRHTDVQHETIIPRHYWVAGYKNGRYCHDKVFPIICLLETKGQVTLMWIVWSAPKSNQSKIFWLSSLPLVMKIQSRNCYRLDTIFWSLWGPKGWVTLMSIVESWQKSNLWKNLCLTYLSASLMKIQW